MFKEDFFNLQNNRKLWWWIINILISTSLQKCSYILKIEISNLAYYSLLGFLEFVKPLKLYAEFCVLVPVCVNVCVYDMNFSEKSGHRFH